MKDYANTHGIHTIAIPTLGCGLDMLDWNKVKKIIFEVFNNTDIKIIVCKR